MSGLLYFWLTMLHVINNDVTGSIWGTDWLKTEYFESSTFSGYVPELNPIRFLKLFVEFMIICGVEPVVGKFQVAPVGLTY